MQLKDVEFVLFDWDGTIADTGTVVVDLLNILLKKYGLSDWKETRKKRDDNLSLQNNFVNYFGEKAVQAYEEYKVLYREMAPKMVKKYEGVDEVVAYLSNKNKKLMIVTNKDRDLWEAEYQRLFADAPFVEVVCGNEAERSKPYPEHIFYALKDYLQKDEIEPKKVWMIGDSRQDSDLALAANALPIRIMKPVLMNENDERIVSFKDFKEFYDFLKRC